MDSDSVTAFKLVLIYQALHWLVNRAVNKLGIEVNLEGKIITRISVDLIPVIVEKRKRAGAKR